MAKFLEHCSREGDRHVDQCVCDVMQCIPVQWKSHGEVWLGAKAQCWGIEKGPEELESVLQRCVRMLIYIHPKGPRTQIIGF